MENNLFMSNSAYMHDIHNFTWQRQGERTLIELIIVDERLNSKVRDARAFRGINDGTDHSLVVCKIRGLFRRWWHRIPAPITELPRIKVEVLKEENKRKEFEKKFKEKLENVIKSLNIMIILKNYERILRMV